METLQTFYQFEDTVLQTSKYISATLIYSLAKQKFARPYVQKLSSNKYRLVWRLIPSKYLKVNVVFWNTWGGEDTFYSPSPGGILDVAVNVLEIHRIFDDQFVVRETPVNISLDINDDDLVAFLLKPTSSSPLFL